MTAPFTTPYIQLRDENGEPAVGWKIYTYEAGTSTPKTTWKDYNKVAANTNPVILDDGGSAVIWLDGAYKFIVKDSDDNLINTSDNILAYPDVDLDGLTATVADLNATDTSVILVGDEDYTVQLSDRGKTIVYNTPLTALRRVYLPKVIDAGNGFVIWLKNAQINTPELNYPIITPNGTEKIDGFSDRSFRNYHSTACVICTGNTWNFKVFQQRGDILDINFNNYGFIDISTDEDRLLYCDATGGSFNLLLPAISTIGSGLEFIVKRADSSANTINLIPNGTDTIDGGSSLSLSHRYETYRLKSDNLNTPARWHIISEVTTVAQWVTGDVKPSFNLNQSGWVSMNDGSIGDAGSGATTRANADTQDLFTLLWTNVSNTYCPVSGGRGASASADFTAGKTLTLPRALGRAMACYGAGAALTSRSLGQYFGEENHALTSAENGPHLHNFPDWRRESNLLSSGGSHNAFDDAITSATQSSGSGTAHNTMQPTIFMNFLIKL